MLSPFRSTLIAGALSVVWLAFVPAASAACLNGGAQCVNIEPMTPLGICVSEKGIVNPGQTYYVCAYSYPNVAPLCVSNGSGPLDNRICVNGSGVCYVGYECYVYVSGTHVCLLYQDSSRYLFCA
jgi:hypothetical protein